MVNLLDGSYGGLSTATYQINNNYPVEFTSYSRDKSKVTINCEDASIPGTLHGQFQVRGDNVTWSHLTINYRAVGIIVADSGTGINLHVHHCTFNAAANVSLDNSGAIVLSGDCATRATGFLIEHNVINGEDNTLSSGNAGAIYVRLTFGVIRYNVITGRCRGIYFKHPNNFTGMDTYIYANYFHVGSYSGDTPQPAIYGLFNSLHIEHNVFRQKGINIGDNGGGGCSGGTCDNSEILHNTFHSGATISTWANADCDGWMVADNLLQTNPHYNDGDVNWSRDYNMYPSGYAHGEGHGMNGSPVFVGGLNPAVVEGFALQSGTTGTQAASDGKGLGADITLFSGFGDTAPPNGDTAPPAGDTDASGSSGCFLQSAGS